MESIFKETTTINLEVILIDNASHDCTGEANIENFPQVKLLVSKENHGFAQGCNLAAKNACGEYILLLNPDTVVIDRAVERLFAFARANPEAGIYGGRTIFPDGRLNPDFCYRKKTLWSLFCQAFGLTKLFRNTNLFNPEPYGSWKYDSVREVDIITGCFLMVKTELWRQLKCFNPLFFMFGEEVDFCLRAKKHGFKPMFTPDATVIHYGGVSEPKKVNSIVSTMRAEVTLIHEHWPRAQVGFGVKMIMIRVRIKSIILSLGAALGFQGCLEKASIWKGAWERRREWMSGWSFAQEETVSKVSCNRKVNHE